MDLELIEPTDITAHHDIYEDLGINSTSVLDPSFNVNHFGVLGLPEDDPSRTSRFMCSLAGSTALTDQAQAMSSARQSPRTASGSGSGYVSPTAQISMNGHDIFLEPLTTELPSTSKCPKVGLRSSFPLDEQACPGFDIPGETDVDVNAFEFPSWDQLPPDFQNPTSSADFYSTIPISTSDGNIGDVMAWDNDEMNFAMDLDLDLDMDLSGVGI